MKYEISIKETQILDDDREFEDQALNFRFIDSDDEKIYSIARNAAKLDCTPAEVASSTCPAYQVINLRSSGKTIKLIRTYPKYLEMMGEIGGTAELIIILATFAYMFYNVYWMNRLKKNIVLKYDMEEYKKMYMVENPKQEKELDKITEQIIEKRDDILRLYYNQTSWEVIQEALFKDYHTKLFPLVRLHMEKMEWEEETSALGGISEPILDQVAKNRLKKASTLNFSSVDSLESAIDQLKNSKPANEVEKSIKTFFLENIPQCHNARTVLYNSMNEKSKDPWGDSEMKLNMKRDKNQFSNELVVQQSTHFVN
jgi:hypothetical protein